MPEVREHLTRDQRPFLQDVRTTSRIIGPQHKKYSSIFHCTHGVLFIPVFTKPILSICC